MVEQTPQPEDILKRLEHAEFTQDADREVVKGLFEDFARRIGRGVEQAVEQQQAWSRSRRDLRELLIRPQQAVN